MQQTVEYWRKTLKGVSAKLKRPHLFGAGVMHYLTDLAYSVGVMPNFSLNWREKWCTVEY